MSLTFAQVEANLDAMAVERNRIVFWEHYRDIRALLRESHDRRHTPYCAHDGMVIGNFSAKYEGDVSSRILDILEARGTEASVCNNCGRLAWVNEDHPDWCDSCDRNDATDCENCGDRVLYDNTTSSDVGRICDDCYDNYVTCEECGHGYLMDSGHTCRNCACRPANPEFLFPNNGHAPLKSDTRTVVTLAAGMISEVGINTIYRYLANSDSYETRCCARYIQDLDPQWVVTRGPLAGTYPKRLAKLAWQRARLKLDPSVLAQVGSIARDNTETQSTYDIEVTRDLENRDMWVYKDSCWWGEYARGRCALKQMGGLGIRGYDPNSTDPTYRAWIVPLAIHPIRGGRALAPTEDALEATAYIVFNGYVDIGSHHPDGYTLTMARLVSHLASRPYAKVRFGASEMYVNDSAGYLIAGQDMLDEFTEVTLHFEVSH